VPGSEGEKKEEKGFLRNPGLLGERGARRNTTLPIKKEERRQNPWENPTRKKKGTRDSIFRPSPPGEGSSQKRTGWGATRKGKDRGER